MREYKTPAVVEVPDSARLSDIVFDKAERQPDAVVLRRNPGPAPGTTWRDVTAREFRDEVASLAKGLIGAGIREGDRVGLMSRTRFEWTLVDYAIWTAGAITVPVYETSSAEQLEWILSDSGARAIVVETGTHLETIATIARRLPELEWAWVIEPNPPTAAEEAGAVAGAPPAGSLDALVAEGAGLSDTDLAQRRMRPGARDLATIIYTSGTTGRPKGCKITHGNLLATAHNVIGGPLSVPFAPGASTLMLLPLAHSFARILEVGALEGGMVLGHNSDVRFLLQDLASFRPTFLLAVPRVFEKVYNGAERQASQSRVRSAIFRSAAQTAIAWSRAFGVHDTAQSGAGPGPVLRIRHAVFDRLVYGRLRAAVGGRVHYAISGGAPLGERLGHFFRGVEVTILEGWGLTETTAPATVNRPDGNNIGTVGQPLPGVSVRIAEDGEIITTGPNLFAGYWQNDSATAEALTPDGWLLTGDLGELDDEGYLRVTGRKKELLVTAGGKNVAPAVLEDRIRAHPLVSQALVVGDGRPYIAGLITLDPEAIGPWLARKGRAADTSLVDLTRDPELIAELQADVDEANQAVSRSESVRKFHVLPIDFTEQNGYLTPSLKLRRNLVIKDFADEIEALYS